jgi:hypothetical protein
MAEAMPNATFQGGLEDSDAVLIGLVPQRSGDVDTAFCCLHARRAV